MTFEPTLHDPPKRAGGYIRVSQERAAQNGYGLDAQLTDVQRYVAYQRWELVKVYREGGVSGLKRNRPALNSLLADAGRGILDVVLFPSIDRAARSVQDMIEIDAALREANVTVVFIREGIDTLSPMGQLFRNIVASIAQLEAKIIYERMDKGRRVKRTQGGYVGGWLPYGYARTEGRLVPTEEEAAIVRLMFQWRIEGYTISRIVDELNRQGVKTQRDSRWRYSTIEGICNNPVYAGWLEHEGEYIPGSHEAIITPETFNRAQMVFQNAAQRRQYTSKRIRLPEKQIR